MSDEVAKYIAFQLEACGKSQREVAEEVGFPKPNMITMIKQGKSRLPISRVAAMAKALGVDPIHLLKLVLKTYEPDVFAMLDGLLPWELTENEREIITCVRSSGVKDPILTPKLEKAIKNAIS